MRGRYYFSPPSTPFADGPTLLGSRNWYGNGTPDGKEPAGTLPPVLGETLGTRQRWDSGALPVTVPDAVQLGSADCLANGELVSDGIDIADRPGGFPNGCFLPTPPPNVDFEFGFTVWSCPTQLFWAVVILELSEGHTVDAADLCAARFQASTVTAFGRTNSFPAFLIVKHANYCCVATSGTDQLGQVLIQALQLIQGPQNYGTFGTGGLWYDYATFLLSTLSGLGLLDNRPILIAGHSYGGCSALILAARLRAAQPKRLIRYVTYGAPKPGDVRLQSQIREGFDGLSLANDGDFITSLPPTSDVIAAMADFLPIGSFLPWVQWQYAPETTLMVGKLTNKNTYQRFGSIQLYQFIANVWSTGKLLTVPAHQVAEYVYRIQQRCSLFVPTDDDLVYGMAFVPHIDAAPGEVLGMTFVPGPIRTTCCPSGTPVTVPFRFVSVDSPLNYVNGLTTTLTYDATVPEWRGGLVVPGHGTWTVRYWCDITWHVQISAGATFNASHAVPACGTLYFSSVLIVSGQAALALCVIGEGDIMPTGSCVPFAGSTIPTGWLECDGSDVSRTTYSVLFGIIGTTWGPGDGSTTFNLPDLRDRVAIGQSPGSLGPDRPTARTLADVGGEETHVLTVAELANHDHPYPGGGNGYVVQSGSDYTLATGSDFFLGKQSSAHAQGADDPHNNVQPFAVLVWIIQT